MLKLPLTLPPTQIDISGLLMICYQILHVPAFILTNLKKTNLVFQLLGGELSRRKSKIVTWTCNHRELKRNGNLIILADCCWPAYSQARYCSSQPSMVHWLSSPIFPCLSVRSSVRPAMVTSDQISTFSIYTGIKAI